MNEKEEPKSEFPDVTGEGLTSESANKTPISRMDKAIKRLTKDELEEYLRDVTLSLLYRDEYIGAKYIEMMEYDAEGRK